MTRGRRTGNMARGEGHVAGAAETQRPRPQLPWLDSWTQRALACGGKRAPMFATTVARFRS
eukprot:CAMPEP_0206046018 /NCGR_PEP_ID=MMETSP1466-20131121/17517_1 /ASSEMBLY_ACC=CAM_ASM_001126 /TAXON_ID=44452 /ORGANISM="Pavlova gyrans, Strain CCMP608" /LENGTH=60 /DNA_ID=CAMNT_0053420981 /DNA_START=53 /DNA_END=233 /DNA_ORIENTATION=+